jgi:hypothetical protein
MSETTNHVSYPILILACIASIIATVVMLEKSGKIRHNEDKGALPLSSYQVIYMTPEQKEAYRLSPKPSMQTAHCHQGYLFIAADNDPALQGLLVDYKNRGVKCAASLAAATEQK